VLLGQGSVALSSLLRLLAILVLVQEVSGTGGGHTGQGKTSTIGQTLLVLQALDAVLVISNDDGVTLDLSR